MFLIWGTCTLSAQEVYSGSISPVFKRQNSFGSHGLSLRNTPSFAPMSLSSVSVKAPDPDIRIYSGLGENIVNSFKGNNLYLHAAGIVSTALIVTTGSDYYVFKYFNEHPAYGNAARPVIHFAQYFPFAVMGSLYAYGKLNTDQEAVAASFAVLQSSALALVYNSLLKAVTGRPHPNWREESDMEGLSKTFRFGFLRGGIFWGWPSGHTSSTMAVVSALTSFYPDKTWLKIVGYGYTAYMMFGVSSLNRGGMHWFSDAVAAAFMSYAIGSTVGKYYRSQFENRAPAQAGGPVSPQMQFFPDFSFSIPL
ncbi:MAG TPA: phosphatase PAP2 family protein [Ignavibacteriales bacterium]|nr:phosphatase PAP2 family protein [Ignavibacteriales bacterium]